MKPVLNNKPDMKNPKHAEVLSGCGIDYDKPMSPVDVAVKRADRISKEKQLAAVSHSYSRHVDTQSVLACLTLCYLAVVFGSRL